MEAGQLPLEDSLLAHKRGMELLQYCQSKLQDAQQQVRLLEADTLKNFSPSGIDDR
jgi:exodeoxyribonuclease VII small subunit